MSDTARYLLGALLAVASGAVFNLGVLIQKKAVNTVPADGANLMHRLVRDRKWVSGLLLQFVVGTPMYAAAQIFIGPALIPGLMATGLVVLPAWGGPIWAFRAVTSIPASGCSSFGGSSPGHGGSDRGSAACAWS